MDANLSVTHQAHVEGLNPILVQHRVSFHQNWSVLDNLLQGYAGFYRLVDYRLASLQGSTPTQDQPLHDKGAEDLHCQPFRHANLVKLQILVRNNNRPRREVLLPLHQLGHKEPVLGCLTCDNVEDALVFLFVCGQEPLKRLQPVVDLLA